MRHHHRAQRRSGAALLAVLASTPIALRVLLITDAGETATVVDLRGFLSDAAVALVVFALVLFVARIARVLGVALALAWVGLNFANAELIRVVGAPASLLDLRFLGDATFLRGSAVAISRPWLAACAAAVTTVAVWWWSREIPAMRGAMAVALAVALFFVHGWIPENANVASFRQLNFAQWNIEGLVTRSRDRGAATIAVADPRAAMRAFDPQLAADLGGRSLLPTQGRARNVLLLVLESVSGAYLEGMAGAHGRTPIGALPRLDGVAAAGLRYDRFFTLQRKTNRGLYALLCGDLPNLAGGLPKMSAYPETGGHRCLPRILRDAGYRTAYVQAAPLGFMLKGQFMPRAGFETVRGREWFTASNARSVWGVDDRAFFARSADLLDELTAGDAPWFLTLLNVGTHHPYIFPDDFQPNEPSRFLRALAYLDLALGEFLDGLEASGVLDEILLVVVSDESMGVPGVFVDPWEKAISQNWGILIVRGPGVSPAAVAAPFSQADVALSILDYLGLGAEGVDLFGRSAFRDYDEPRRIYFANTNLHAAGALDRDGALLMCVNDFARCRKWAPRDARTFAVDSDELSWNPESDGFVRDMVLRSVQTIGSDAAPRMLELVGESRIHLDRKGEGEVIHGGQYVDLREGDWIEVELEVTATGDDPDTRVQFTHILKRDVPPAPFVEKIEIAAGQTLRLHYSYAPGHRAKDVQSHSMGELLAGDAADLVFGRARMTLHRSGSPPGPELTVATNEVAATP